MHNVHDYCKSIVSTFKSYTWKNCLRKLRYSWQKVQKIGWSFIYYTQNETGHTSCESNLGTKGLTNICPEEWKAVDHMKVSKKVEDRYIDTKGLKMFEEFKDTYQERCRNEHWYDNTSLAKLTSCFTWEWISLVGEVWTLYIKYLLLYLQQQEVIYVCWNVWMNSSKMKWSNDHNKLVTNTDS